MCDLHGRSLADGTGKAIDAAKFEKHFALAGADWFSKRLLHVFVETEILNRGPNGRGQRVTLEGFREGGT